MGGVDHGTCGGAYVGVFISDARLKLSGSSAWQSCCPTRSVCKIDNLVIETLSNAGKCLLKWLLQLSSKTTLARRQLPTVQVRQKYSLYFACFISKSALQKGAEAGSSKLFTWLLTPSIMLLQAVGLPREDTARERSQPTCPWPPWPSATLNTCALNTIKDISTGHSEAQSIVARYWVSVSGTFSNGCPFFGAFRHRSGRWVM